jgi:adenylate kinase
MIMLNILLLGAPGSGKGTQSKLLAQKLELLHCAAGDILRNCIQSQSPLGDIIRQTMASGTLVDDKYIIDMITCFMQQNSSHNGYIFDGFPRTLAQAIALTEMLHVDIQHSTNYLDHVFELSVPNEVIIARLSRRRFHIPSGRVYHLDFHPPITPNIDDITGEELSIRPDDLPDIIANRLKLYHIQLQGIKEYYMTHGISYHVIDGNAAITTIAANILSHIHVQSS